MSQQMVVAFQMGTMTEFQEVVLTKKPGLGYVDPFIGSVTLGRVMEVEISAVPGINPGNGGSGLGHVTVRLSQGDQKASADIRLSSRHPSDWKELNLDFDLPNPQFLVETRVYRAPLRMSLRMMNKVAAL